MRTVRSILFIFALLPMGMLHAEAEDSVVQTNFEAPYTGLKNDLIIDVKPKSCDFQWWKGSKNYSTFGGTGQKTDQGQSQRE